MIFGGVFEQLPDLRVAFAHGGGAFPATVGRIQHGFNVRPDLCAIDNNIAPIDYLGKFWVDSLVHDMDMLRYLIDKVGDKKINIIKEVRAATGLGLKEAKDLVEGAPKPIKEGAAKAEAEEIKKKFEEAGAKVELK